jgi:degradative hydroxymethylglutaryl-CoA reductase
MCERSASPTSAFTGFFKLATHQRLARLSEAFQLTDDDVTPLSAPDAALDSATCDTMIENYIARHMTPVGVATNFIVDGQEIVVPMAIEEPSVIAGASLAAKLARPSGGFTTAAGSNICSGQVVFMAPPRPGDHLAQLSAISSRIVETANATMPAMVSRGGGTHGVEFRQVDTDSGKMLIVDLHVRVGDSMGANAVTQACEAVKAFVHSELGFAPLMGILTNLAQRRIVYASCRWRIADLAVAGFDGFDVANRIIMAANLARADAARAATHRKGIMNGSSAVVAATGNDTRAVEAAIHSYAALPTSNPALTQYRIDDNQDLVGEIWIPVPVGIVGGSINRDKSAPTLRRLMKVESARDLVRVIAAVGLAQNFAALRALVTQGISAGHMKLHSRNVACEAGATGDEIDLIANKMVVSGAISVSTAKSFLMQMRCELV